MWFYIRQVKKIKIKQNHWKICINIIHTFTTSNFAPFNPQSTIIRFPTTAFSIESGQFHKSLPIPPSFNIQHHQQHRLTWCTIIYIYSNTFAISLPPALIHNKLHTKQPSIRLNASPLKSTTTINANATTTTVDENGFRSSQTKPIDGIEHNHFAPHVPYVSINTLHFFFSIRLHYMLM